MTKITKKSVVFASNKIQLIAIGASAGGPLILQQILSKLPQDFPPILIVQHIAAGFVQGLAQWLGETAHKSIYIAEERQVPQRGHIYLAPDHYFMGIAKNSHIFLEANKNNISLCPSIDFLFSQVANVFKEKAIGILLTGMGHDGALGLKNMKEQGAITIAQDKSSALIYSMPGKAVALDAVTYVLTPAEISEVISSLSFSGRDL